MLNKTLKYLINYPLKLLFCVEIHKNLIILSLIIIYIISILAAFFEGISLILLATIFTNFNSISSNLPDTPILGNFSSQLDNLEISDVFSILTFTFFLAFLFKWSLVFLEGYFTTKIRRKIQIELLRKYIHSNWNLMKNYRVGHLVNINNNEAINATKYVMSAIMLPTHVLICMVFLFLALTVDYKILIFFTIILFPLLLVVKLIIKKQSQLSLLLTNIRNSYTSNITDRINGLMDIYNLKKKSFHHKRGVRGQSDYTKSEIKVCFFMSIMQTLNLSIPLIILLIISIFNLTSDKNFTSLPLFELTAVGLLGYKSLSSINFLNVYLGNLARLSGSLFPLFEIFNLKKEIIKKSIKDDIDQIKLEKVNFKYGNKQILNNLNFTFYRGKINIISGSSGKGKTTIASLISGLIDPDAGKLIFKSTNKHFYVSSDYEFKLGYLTQNVYLFNDTLKDNLVLGEKISDKKIWKTLQSVNAKTFVEKTGGLYQNVQEAGKNFSGGQIRRLGIARMLLLNSKILLLDEPLSGLDEENKNLFLKLILKLYNDFLVIIITHEEIKIKNSIKNILRI